MNLTGKTILITGATAGIGYETLKQLAAAGASSIALGRSSPRLAALEGAPGVGATYACDLADIDAVRSTARAIAQAHPDIDVLINNAGMQQDLLFDDPENTVDGIVREVTVNFTSPMVLVRELLENLRARPEAAIVNVTSGLALVPKTRSAVYCGTKGGLRLFSRALRNQLTGTTLRVCEVLPPLVDTAMTAGRGKGKIPPSAVAEAIVGALRSDRAEVFVGKARMLYWLDRLVPGIAAGIMRKAG